MSQAASREVTPEMISGNLLSHECVMAAIFEADVMMSVSLRVFEQDTEADSETPAQPGCPLP